MRDLTESLRRYLEISRRPAGASIHTSQVSISFGEQIDPAALRAGWEALARSTPELRTTLQADGSAEVGAEPSLGWTELDWDAAPPEDLGAAWQALVSTDATTAIATESQPAVRVTFIRLPGGGGHALWTFHAGLLDEPSVSIVLRQWLHAYDCVRTGAEVPSFEAPEVAATESDDSWKAAFEGLASRHPLIVLPLPGTSDDPDARRSVTHTFERPERAEFAAAAERCGGTLRGLFTAAWAFVLARATTSTDALVLEPVRESIDLVGRQETFVLRRYAVESHTTSADLVSACSEAAPTPPATAAIAQALGLPPADLEPSACFVYRDLPLNDRLLLDAPRWMAADVQLLSKSPAGITLRITAGDRPDVALDYDPARLSEPAARLLLDAVIGTIRAIAAAPEAGIPLADLSLPGTPAEVEAPEAPRLSRSLVPQGIHELFADIAQESPDAVAVEMADEKLTFAQLDTAANQLARYMRKHGVESGARVGVAMPRSPRWITTLLGILKAGATIVPLDETTREAAAKIKAWVVDSLEEGDQRSLPVIQVHSDAGAIGNEKSRGVQAESALAKEAVAWNDGDMVRACSHEKFVGSFESTAALLELTPADRVLQFAPTGTFHAVEEAFVTLLSGATLVLREGNRWPTRTTFQEFVGESAITAISVPVPFWSQWTHYLADLSISVPATLRVAMISDGLPSANTVAAWRKAAGQTRLLQRTPCAAACGLSLCGEPAADDALSAAYLGTPAPSALARIVDRHGRAVPAGLAGRIEIAAKAEAPTYASLGAEAFVSPEGVFYARTPLEIQVAGVAPGTLAEAIRIAAASHPDVLDAYVEEHLVAARNEWCVWIIPRDSERGEPHDFRDWLAEKLPTVPRRIRALPRLPLDETGHIDRAALKELLPEDVAAHPTARKGNETEERVRQAISRALGGRRIELEEILTDGATKPQVAKLLHESVSRIEPRVELTDFTSGFSVRSLLRNVRGRRSSSGSTWKPIQPLRASGKQPPLVFIHDLDGSAKIYEPLVAHFGENQPCYAITARGLADPESCHMSVDEMARAYVEALRVFDAAGPYRLIGYGFGGLVANEMARLLAESGAQVPLLVALATEPPGGGLASSLLAGDWKRSLRGLTSLFGKSAPEEPKRRRGQDSAVYRANQEAARRYTAHASPLTAHVFAPEEDFPAFRAVQNGWLAVCKDVRVYQVPCTGPEMMDEPAVESIAEAISKLVRAEELTTELEEGEENEDDRS